jgi:hypothetical protein
MRYGTANKAEVCLSREQVDFGSITIDPVVKESIKVYNSGTEDLEYIIFQEIDEGLEFAVQAQSPYGIDFLLPGASAEVIVWAGLLQQTDFSSGITTIMGKDPGPFSGNIMIVSNAGMTRIPYRGYVSQTVYEGKNKPIQTEFLTCSDYDDCLRKCKKLGFTAGMCIENTDCVCS